MGPRRGRGSRGLHPREPAHRGTLQHHPPGPADKRGFAPVGYQRYNKSTGKVVDWNDVVKGYEYEKGEYVVLTGEDFRRATVEASLTIDIQTFVGRGVISPYYFDTPYYLFRPHRVATLRIFRVEVTAPRRLLSITCLLAS